MRIRCPHCGTRDNGEFSYLGDASPIRPDGMETEASAMHDYVYLRDNLAGEHRELWYHGAGCRTWLVVTRDTSSHAILDVSPARDVALNRRTGDAA